MELHRIIAPDASKATAEALRLYGREALILSTRRLDNQKTEIIVATEAPEDAPALPPSTEPLAEGKAFKAAFEAQLNSEGAPKVEPASSGEAKAAFLREQVAVPAPPSSNAQGSAEGMALLTAIHEELARLRSEVGALQEARNSAKRSQDRERLEALGFGEGPLEAILDRLDSGKLPALPRLSEGAQSQARWLAHLLAPTSDQRVLRGRHVLRAEDHHVQAGLAVALASSVAKRQGPGASLLIAVGQDPSHWRAISRAGLEAGLQVLWAGDGHQLAELLGHPGLNPELCLLLPDSGEEADALRRLPLLAKAPRHQILPADRLASPFLGNLLGGSETDSVMIHGFHKEVPLRHFVATMLEAGKPLSLLCDEDNTLSLGENASLRVMAAWVDKPRVDLGVQENTASPWPLASHG